MQIKIMLAAAIFFGGWLLSYVFIRQLLFNFVTAYPLIKKMQSIDEDLIAVGARRYTSTSVLVCILVSAVIVFLVVYFCPKYLIISFFVGVLICLVMLLNKIAPQNRPMFDNFCVGYCRFVPDDELRTIMYNKDVKKINRRLREMGYDHSFVPEFKKD
ncbi:MAG: hypothetical protein IJV40_09010 [Oscillospiraceae bacterium]|nr:hypothetical protein [Oscillospiraceae bacterium]